MAFYNHVNDVVRACNYKLRALRHIRPSKTSTYPTSSYRRYVHRPLELLEELVHGNVARLVSDIKVSRVHDTQTTCYVSQCPATFFSRSLSCSSTPPGFASLSTCRRLSHRRLSRKCFYELRQLATVHRALTIISASHSSMPSE